MRTLFLSILLTFLSFSIKAQTVLDTVSIQDIIEKLEILHPNSFILNDSLFIFNEVESVKFSKDDEFETIFYGGKMVYKCLSNNCSLYIRKKYIVFQN